MSTRTRGAKAHTQRRLLSIFDGAVIDVRRAHVTALIRRGVYLMVADADEQDLRSLPSTLAALLTRSTVHLNDPTISPLDYELWADLRADYQRALAVLRDGGFE